MWKRLSVIITILMFVAGMAACQQAQSDQGLLPTQEGFRNDPADRVASTGRPQVIEFYATYCSECIALRPILYRLEDEYDGKVDFVFLDTDNKVNDAVRDRFHLSAHPYSALLAPDGTIIQQWYGHISEDTYREAIDAYLQQGG